MTTIIGRQEELALGARFLDDVATAPAALLLEGPAGIGKTTVWGALLDEAERRSYRLLRCRAAESDAQLAFSGLSDLLIEVIEEMSPALPAPMRVALDTALLRHTSDGPPLDLRALATAVLRGLDRLSGVAPLIIAIDDLQWLDRSSGRVLEFAVQRLRGQQIGLLATTRWDGAGVEPRPWPAGAFPVDRVTSVTLRPMTLAALHHLVVERFGEVLSRPALTRLEAASGGNPLLAVEIMGALKREGRPLTFDQMLPIPTDVRQLVARRTRGLGPETRAMLLTVAALGHPDLDLLARTAKPRDDVERRLAEAVDSGLLITDEGRARFTHPLFGAAVYGAATNIDRREVHLRLADVVRSLEQRARHVALATSVPDGAVAALLDAAADDAAARGGLDAAADLQQHAVRLTPATATEDATRRRLALAGTLWEIGEVARSRAIVNGLVSAAEPGHHRAEVLLLQAAQTAWEEGPAAAVPICLGALAHAADDGALQAAIHLRIAYLADDDLSLAIEHADVAVRLLGGLDAPAPELLACALLLRAEASLLAGKTVDEGDVTRAIESLPPPPDPPARRAALNARGIARERLWIIRQEQDRLLEARSLLEDLHRGDRESGLDRAAPIALADLAELDCWLGDLDSASLRAVESVELAEQTGATRHGRAMARLAMAYVATYRGDLDVARRTAIEGLEICRQAVDEALRPRFLALLGFIELSDDHPHEAARHLADVRDTFGRTGVRLASMLRCRGDEIEALALMGELGPARERLDALFRDAGPAPGPWVRSVGSRSRALVAAAYGEIDAALEALDEALGHHEALAMPLETGRTWLLKGQLHRRRRGKRLAADALRQAEEVFERVGSLRWAARARREAARVGLRPAATDALTATEEQVALLAASGRTNREVAQALVLSPKTIDGVLARVYQKLGIRSRAELGARMRDKDR